MSALALSKSNAARSLQRFWYWWSGELAALIPQRLKEAARERNRLDFILSADGVVVEEVLAGVGRRLQEARLLEALDAEAWVEIEQFCAGQVSRLLLAPSDYLRIDLKLPRAASADLEEAVRLQLHLHSPLKPDATDWAVRKIGVGGESLDAALIIARASRIDAISTLFAEHGLMPPIIAAPLDDVPLVLRKPLDLPSGEERTIANRIYTLAAALILLIPIVTMFTADITTSANNTEAAQIETEIAPKLAANRQAQRAENMRRKLSPITQAPSIVLIMEEVAKLLPDTMWVRSAYALSDRRVILVVDGPERKDAAEPLSGSSLFRDASVIDEAPSEEGRADYQIELAIK